MRYHSYLNSAKKIIESYRGEIPFAAFIKKYFAAEKKYGGKDRKQIATLCYHFFRLGKAIPELPVEEKIIVAVFLCERKTSDFLQCHKPEWNEIITKPVSEKMKILGFTHKAVFPWPNELSTGIDFQPFCNAFFQQPDLFLRIRPGNREAVLKKLEAAGIEFYLLHDDCIALANSTRIDNILEIDKEVIVQDYNSQQVLNGIRDQVSSIKYQVSSIPHPISSIQYPVSSIPYPVSGIQHPVSVWDCCAASGGKSILVYDILEGQIELTVSDIRENILANLSKRFATAGIKNYKSFVADLSVNNPPDHADCQSAGSCELPTSDYQPAGSFGLLICDAPCTGSGTWSRTPEQLYYFKPQTIDAYAAMQQRIVSNVIPHLQEDGLFIYITCSVFKKENEAMVDFIKEKFHLQLLQVELLKGYNKKADSMFTAVFKK